MSRAYWNYIFSLEAQKRARKINRRSIRDASNPFEFPDSEFQRLFRVDKACALYVCEELNEALKPNAGDGLPVYIKVLTSVRLMADGNYQRSTGQDHGLTIAQTTVSKYLTQVTSAIVRILMPKWILFPGTDEARQNVSRGFLAKHGLPDILGAIDCTHVDISHPPFSARVQYKNMKGRFSINVQLIADVECHILSINAKFPGGIHNQLIFNNSNVKGEMKRLYDNEIGQYYLLGDSGYALEPWLMTPDLEAEPNSPAEKYNNWHRQVHTCVERTNGYLRGTFRSLGHDRVLRYAPYKASQFIYACATLYNIMLHYKIPMNNLDESEKCVQQQYSTSLMEQTLLTVAQQKRQTIINTYFN